ncbi:MAG: dockerin type I domain-containing protein [Patescibacteria group bacterium]
MNWINKIVCICVCVGVLSLYQNVLAVSSLSWTLSLSIPSESADHTITFTTQTQIPASGKIVLTPQAEYFTIPVALNYTDFDLSIEGTQKEIDGSATVSFYGVAVTSGASGSFEVTLPSAEAINSGSQVQLTVGSIATHQTQGERLVRNPSVSGNYKMHIAIYNSSNILLDYGQTVVSIVDQVTVTASIPSTALNQGSSSTIGAGGDAAAQVDFEKTDSETTVGAFLRADLNNDVQVNIVDLSIMMTNWGQTTVSKSDLNFDGIIDLIDLSILLHFWGYKYI